MKKMIFAALVGLASLSGSAFAGTSYVDLATCEGEFGKTAKIGVETSLDHRTAISGTLEISQEISLYAHTASVQFIAAGGGQWNLTLNGMVDSTISFTEGEFGPEVYVQFTNSSSSLEGCKVDFDALNKLAPAPFAL